MIFKEETFGVIPAEPGYFCVSKLQYPDGCIEPLLDPIVAWRIAGYSDSKRGSWSYAHPVVALEVFDDLQHAVLRPDGKVIDGDRTLHSIELWTHMVNEKPSDGGL